MDKDILQKLALERCRVHVSHMGMLVHLGREGGTLNYAVPESLHGVFESLSRELCLIESLMDEN